MTTRSDEIDRDRAGRFRPGAASPNPKGRPKKQTGIDAAVLGAAADMITVTEAGKRKRKAKIIVAAAQVANQGASGDLRAAKLLFDETRKSEERRDAAVSRAAIMTEHDREIADRVIATLTKLITQGATDGSADA